MKDVPLPVHVEGPIARLTLDRPDAGKAIDRASADAQLDGAIRCDSDPAIRHGALAGSGRLFCAGGDIGSFAGAAAGATADFREGVAAFVEQRNPAFGEK